MRTLFAIATALWFASGWSTLTAEPTPRKIAVSAVLQKLMDDDDQAREDVEKWHQEANHPTNVETAPLKVTLQRRIDDRLGSVRSAYEAFLKTEPTNAPAHLAYGSFLGDMGDEDGMVEHWEKARELDPLNPAAWNNLAGHFAHQGPIEKAFPYYEKAIELNPKEPQYWHTFGTVVFLFRKDAQERYHTNEQGVFAKALDLYAHAMALDPTNFILASNIAQTYYGIKPAPAENGEKKQAAESRLIHEALASWTNAWKLVGGPVEEQGVKIHIARWKIRAKRFQEARVLLSGVTNEVYLQVRNRIERNISAKERAD
ncbi:MAG: hypothetical protein EXS36_13185 [Pedosphaera sp.]|nr:hypothetical protein [Pedosphaera sp.]